MRAAQLAWGAFAFFVVTGACGIVLLALVPDAALAAEGDSLWLSLLFVLVVLVFAVVGAIVAQHQPRNPIGWLFLGLAVIEGAFELAYGYTHYSLAVTELPAMSWAAWFSEWSSPASPALIGLSFLLFPNGRLVSRRWRPVAWFCVVGILPVVATYALSPGQLTEFPSITNPAGMDSLAFLDEVPIDALILLVLLPGAISIIVRLRRSTEVERLQVKWFAWAGGLVVGFLLVGGLVESLLGDRKPVETLAGVVFAFLLCGMPISAGIAIQRYRLYEIDRLISRTLVYAVLTAILVATYLVSVLLFRVLLDPLTGGSDLAVATSTLAVAALFRPLRGRIQDVVDRRFYRSRYDSARTVESFMDRLRQEVDLDAVSSELRHVVGDTIQPTHMSLWLRRTEAAR